MKKAIIILIYLFFNTSFSQLKLDFIEVNQYKRDSIIGIDGFSFKYFLNNTNLKKVSKFTNFNYSNLKLGKITQLDIVNPLKTIVLYKATNSTIVLDNRFAEIKIINFNQIQNPKLVSHVSNANHTNFWIFNTIDNRLELFDYKTLTSKVKTNPITSKILDITSDYNYVWLLTQEHILCYNYAGSLIYKLKNDNYKALKNVDENLILQSKNSLYFYNKDTKKIDSISLTHQLINSFFVSQQNLYIYELNKLYTYQLNY